MYNSALGGIEKKLQVPVVRGVEENRNSHYRLIPTSSAGNGKCKQPALRRRDASVYIRGPRVWMSISSTNDLMGNSNRRAIAL